MRIERLRIDETERLRTIRLRSLLDTPDAFGSTHAEVMARPADTWHRQLQDLATFVAVADGSDVGIVRGESDNDNATWAWLLSMWVAPEARGQGIGEALIASIIDWAKASSFDRLLLDVGDFNTHAINLYERMGFAKTGITARLDPPREQITEHQRVRHL